jgi:hypothetical protein
MKQRVLHLTVGPLPSYVLQYRQKGSVYKQAWKSLRTEIHQAVPSPQHPIKKVIMYINCLPSITWENFLEWVHSFIHYQKRRTAERVSSYNRTQVNLLILKLLMLSLFPLSCYDHKLQIVSEPKRKGDFWILSQEQNKCLEMSPDFFN